jgi:hypothetical protein
MHFKVPITRAIVAKPHSGSSGSETCSTPS